MAESITIKKPFDSHVHLRRGAMLRAVTPITAGKFFSAIVMPNTDPPIATLEQALEYKKEILAVLPSGNTFKPLMTFYLTKTLKPEEIERGFGNGVYAIKYYPYGATTNSQWGSQNILDATDVLKKMEEVGMPLLLHGEVHVNAEGTEVDPYEGERLFIADVLPRLLDAYPKLKISLEHLSTAVAADFLEKNGRAGQLVATITPMHLMYDKEIAAGKPLLHMKPLLKTAADRERVRVLATSGHAFISGGTDSAPHPESKKFATPPAFGAFSSPTAVELYTQVFDEMGALDKLENFLSINGPKFFGIEPSNETITLEKKDWQMTNPIICDDGVKVWPMSPDILSWKIAG